MYYSKTPLRMLLLIILSFAVTGCAYSNYMGQENDRHDSLIKALEFEQQKRVELVGEQASLQAEVDELQDERNKLKKSYENAEKTLLKLTSSESSHTCEQTQKQMQEELHELKYRIGILEEQIATKQTLLDSM